MTTIDRTQGLSQAAVTARATMLAARFAEPSRAGRGIVIVAGGARIFTNAYVLIAVLRGRLACRLPIALWHFGPGEISPAMRATLDGLAVELVDALPLLRQAGCDLTTGWQLKPFAILAAPFAEVLLLDADQVPVSDPAALFDWPHYRAAGAVFWPDVVDLRAENPVWAALGLTPEATASFDSGQVLVDVTRHAAALATAVALNEQADTLFRLIYGDKDTFLLAWRLTGAAAAVAPHRPFADDRAMIQRDFAGAPLFQHRSGCKWLYRGEQYRLPGFVHEDACLAALELLREQWNGRVYRAPARSLAARDAEARLIASGRHAIDIPDEGRTAIALRDHHEFGTGRAYDRQTWHVRDTVDGLRLVFSDGERDTYVFAPVDAASWAGRRYRFPEADVALLADGPASPPTPCAGLVDDLLRAAGFPAGDDGDLARALALVARIETGVPERLRALAANASEPAAARLIRLAATAEPGQAPGDPAAWRDHEVLAKGYRRDPGEAT